MSRMLSRYHTRLGCRVTTMDHAAPHANGPAIEIILEADHKEKDYERPVDVYQVRLAWERGRNK